MESLIPFFRLMHFVGFALLLGGTLSSVILIWKEKPSIMSAKSARICMHFVAAPGLTLLLLTGLLHSAIIYWENFKGAGYMHVKVMLVLAIFLLMVFDMLVLKRIVKKAEEPDTLSDLFKKRQVTGITICVLTLLIMWLISFRPF